MSLLSYVELVDLVERGVITGVNPDNINGSSIDVTLGDEIFVEWDTAEYGIVDPVTKSNSHLMKVNISSRGNRGFGLVPGQFCLASTNEMFNLPSDISCEFKLKSSTARAGLNHLLAGWCDPNWNGSVLTLELHNVLQRNIIILTTGMKIGQMVFFRNTPVPYEKSYAVRGQYNGDVSVQTSKGNK